MPTKNILNCNLLHHQASTVELSIALSGFLRVGVGARVFVSVVLRVNPNANVLEISARDY